MKKKNDDNTRMMLGKCSENARKMLNLRLSRKSNFSKIPLGNHFIENAKYPQRVQIKWFSM